MKTKVCAYWEKDKNIKWRKWFTGDAAEQRAMSECLKGEIVFPVDVEDTGFRNATYQPGYAIGKKPKNYKGEKECRRLR